MHTAKVQEIIAAAMEATQAGKAYVNVDYDGRLNQVSYSAWDLGSKPTFANSDGMLDFGCATLESPSAADQLDAILTKIKAL